MYNTLHANVQMNYKLDKQLLLDTLSQWNRFLNRRIHLINTEDLEQHFLELISYDISVDRLKPHIDHFLQLLRDPEA